MAGQVGAHLPRSIRMHVHDDELAALRHALQLVHDNINLYTCCVLLLVVHEEARMELFIAPRVSRPLARK